jgi:hypothetical protein
VPAGEVTFLDFVSRANGVELDVSHPESYGTYEDNYRRMAKGWDDRIAGLTHPVRLPEPGIADMYKAIQILLWGCMVRVGDDYEIRAGSPNPGRLESYDRTFPHDVPNYVDEFMREGDYELGKQILASGYYRVLNSDDIADRGGLNYMDTIGKFLLPYAQYLQNTGDVAYFDAELLAFLARAARNISACRVYGDAEHHGLMRKGEDFENWSDDGDYLLCDNLESLKNVRFLHDNQCAPWQWSEAFEHKGRDQWAGMYLPQESYGNYESWGTSFSKQAILQACVSVHVDGTVIIGRGIPDSWLRPGEVVEWHNVNVNDGRLLDFTITSAGAEIVLDLAGDTPLGCVVLDLPALAGNVTTASAGTVLESGAVRLGPGERSVRVSLASPIA